MGMEDLQFAAEEQRLLDHLADASYSAWVKDQQVKSAPDPNALLTVEQVAKRLNITDDQVLAFAHDASLKYIDVGRGDKVPRYRFSTEDVEAFQENRTYRATTSWPSISTKRNRRTTNTTSTSTVVDFTALLDPVTAAKRKK
jgi:excisionase family DNA binding protein